MKSSPLFFASDLAVQSVAQLIAGIVPAEPVDTLDFPAEGGDVARELGAPFLPGMDDFRITAASLNLRAHAKDVETDFKATNVAGGGVIVSLAKPRRIRKIQAQFTNPADSTKAYIVIRSVAGAPGSFQPGPPIFAVPVSTAKALPAAGPLFDPPLAGMIAQSSSGGVRVLTFPVQLGTAWLLQIASGDDATSLSPLPITPVVQKVTADGLPENLALVLAAEDGPIPLWSHPNLLLPESGFQAVSFLPLAQKYLTKKVKDAGKKTLTVPLRFHSDAGCQVDVSGQSLQGEYSVQPLAQPSVDLALGGAWTALDLTAPGGLAPIRATVDITARLLGRVLNAASPEPPIDAPAAGLVVDPARTVATALDFAPLPGDAPGTILPLAAVRVLLAAVQDSEIVLELRADVSGAPGQILGPPLPLQVKAGAMDWIEFLLPKPAPVSAGRSPLWLALRLTRGQALWFGGAPHDSPTRFSTDKAKTWAPPDPILAPVSGLWAQLFHVQPDPQPLPAVRLRRRSATLSESLIASASRVGPREFHAAAAGLPVSAILKASAAGAQFHLFSRAVATLTLSGATLAYDPFSGGAA